MGWEGGRDHEEREAKGNLSFADTFLSPIKRIYAISRPSCQFLTMKTQHFISPVLIKKLRQQKMRTGGKVKPGKGSSILSSLRRQ